MITQVLRDMRRQVRKKTFMAELLGRTPVLDLDSVFARFALDHTHAEPPGRA